MPETHRCFCIEQEQKAECQYSSWPVGLKATMGSGHLFLFQKYEDGTHEIHTIPKEWLPTLREALANPVVTDLG